MGEECGGWMELGYLSIPRARTESELSTPTPAGPPDSQEETLSFEKRNDYWEENQ